MNAITVEVPLRITIEVGSGTPSRQAGAGPLPATATADIAPLERVDIDADYANRRGYVPGFLGVDVPLPPLNEEQRRNAARNTWASQGEDASVLPYHHFSIVMNRRRQLAYYTAVNIDGKQSRQPERSGDRWYFDPRIAESEQIGEDLYARNQLDRGHLVRRLDPAWGASASEALRANNDTFHFTNCSPQHARFNQNQETWQGIENHLLGQATGERQKMSIFTGPVMTEEDPIYRGVRLPLHFWKIAVYLGADAQLRASAYLLDQSELLANLERFNPRTWQVSVQEIIDRTGLDFSALMTHEVKLEEELEEAAGLERAASGLPRRRLTHIEQIIA